MVPLNVVGCSSIVEQPVTSRTLSGAANTAKTIGDQSTANAKGQGGGGGGMWK